MVYFIQQGTDGPIKIGRTAARSPEARLSRIRTGNPYKLRSLLFIEGPNDIALEASLHERFAGARMQGEWFHPTPALLDLIYGGPQALLDLALEAAIPIERQRVYARVTKALKEIGVIEPKRSGVRKPRVTTREKQAGPLPLRYKLERTFG